MPAKRSCTPHGFGTQRAHHAVAIPWSAHDVSMPRFWGIVSLPRAPPPPLVETAEVKQGGGVSDVDPAEDGGWVEEVVGKGTADDIAAPAAAVATTATPSTLPPHAGEKQQQLLHDRAETSRLLEAPTPAAQKRARLPPARSADTLQTPPGKPSKKRASSTTGADPPAAHQEKRARLPPGRYADT